MKLLKVIRHPGLTIASFLLILISGKGFGGFYLLYVLMGLPYGAPHALFALGSLIAIAIGYRYKQGNGLIRMGLYILALWLMIFALVVFFIRSNGYNDGTFYQMIPLISLGLFGLCSLSFLISNLIDSNDNLRKHKRSLEVA